MTIEEMRKIKDEKGYTYEMISERSGVPLGTVVKIFTGETKKPRYMTLLMLERNLFGEDPQREEAHRQIVYKPLDGSPIYVKEKALAWGDDSDAQAANRATANNATANSAMANNATVKDLEQLPAGVKAEIIDGELIRMEAPSILHQRLVLQLAVAFSNFISKKGGPCEVLIEPMVKVTPDEKNWFLPDLVVNCDASRVSEKQINGGPDFIAEVVSPSTKRQDYVEKQFRYAQANVREYWIVDPERKTVTVLFDGVPDEVYSFDAEIPVKIYDGELTIKLA